MNKWMFAYLCIGFALSTGAAIHPRSRHHFKDKTTATVVFALIGNALLWPLNILAVCIYIWRERQMMLIAYRAWRLLRLLKKMGYK